MTINLANNNPRVEYTVAQGVTQQTFAVPFEFFDDGDLSVYVDGVLKVEGVDYTVTGGDGSTGNVVFVTAVPPAVQQVTGAVGGSQVVIVRSIPIERTSDFSAGSDINRAALNEQLDILTAMIADLKSKVDRSPSLPDYDVVDYDLLIPPKAQRLNKYLAFGATGNLTVTSGTTSSIIVSAFGQTLIDDLDAAEARQTLGVDTSNLLASAGVTSSPAELNILDGATLSTTELNYVDGVTSAIQTQLNNKQTLDADLTAIAGLSSVGVIVRSGSGTAVIRSIAGTTDQISITNGDGAAGNPTISAVIASQVEAQAGTNSTKLMTPQRVAQAISSLGASTTLLGTLTTTSATAHTLSSLLLTPYRSVLLEIDNVGVAASGSTLVFGTTAAGIVFTPSAQSSPDTLSGSALICLITGTFAAHVARTNASIGSSGYATNLTGMSPFYGRFDINSLSTSITISLQNTSAGRLFNSGSIRIYGVK